MLSIFWCWGTLPKTWSPKQTFDEIQDRKCLPPMFNFLPHPHTPSLHCDNMSWSKKANLSTSLRPSGSLGLALASNLTEA